MRLKCPGVEVRLNMAWRQTLIYRGQHWVAETSGFHREGDNARSVGVWFTNEDTGEQIHGDLNAGDIDGPTESRLAQALDKAICRHIGLTRAADAAGVHDHDIIATRRTDGLFDVRQRIRGVEHFLEGPLDAAGAQRRARELAAEEQGKAWILDRIALRLLTD